MQYRRQTTLPRFLWACGRRGTSTREFTGTCSVLDGCFAFDAANAPVKLMNGAFEHCDARFEIFVLVPKRRQSFHIPSTPFAHLGRNYVLQGGTVKAKRPIRTCLASGRTQIPTSSFSSRPKPNTPSYSNSL